MQKTNTPTNTPPTSNQPREKIDRRTRSYQRRMKAAGIDPDYMPEDIVEFRLGFTRKIYMYINNWRGCPELICARNRGCMAPNDVCANFPPPTAEEREEWHEIKAELSKAVKAHLAAHGVTDY